MSYLGYKLWDWFYKARRSEDNCVTITLYTDDLRELIKCLPKNTEYSYGRTKYSVPVDEQKEMGVEKQSYKDWKETPAGKEYYNKLSKVKENLYRSVGDHTLFQIYGDKYG